MLSTTTTTTTPKMNPAGAAATTSAPKKEVKWAPGLGDPSDMHIALVDPDMAWDDARLARVLRNDPYLSVTLSPQLPGLVRSYECFADLHAQLLLAHPHESGRTGKMPRTLPFLPDWPAQLDRNTSHRLVRGLTTYLQQLADLPAHILHHPSVAKFCEPPPMPQVPQPAQLMPLAPPPPAAAAAAAAADTSQPDDKPHRTWSTMSNADPNSLPRTHANHSTGPPPPPRRVTSTASSGLSLNLPKSIGSDSAPVSPSNGTFQQQRTHRGTVFPRGSSLPPSPSSTVFPDYPPPVPQPPPPGDHRSPALQPRDAASPLMRSDSPRFAPRSATASQPLRPDVTSVPNRVRSQEPSMAGSALSAGSSPTMHPPPRHYDASVVSPRIPLRGSSSISSSNQQQPGAGPPPRRSTSSSTVSSGSRPGSALPPASPRMPPGMGGSAVPSPRLPPMADDPATPSVPALVGGSADKTVKIKLVFPKLNHVAAVRVRLDALTMGTLLTAVESKVDQAHASQAAGGTEQAVPRPQQYTICYRVPETGKSVKVTNQTLPGIVGEVVGRGEEKVVLYMLY